MQRKLRHVLLAAALIAGGAVAQAEPLTRAEVRADLAEWRALGLLEQGEMGASTAVLEARERFYQTQTRTLIAKYELEQKLQAEREAATAGAPPAPDVVSYTEAGPDGPQVVIVRLDNQGMVEGYETVMLASID